MFSGSPPSLVSVPEQVAKAIAESILKNEIKPGANLREIPLAEFFGVSRSSVREALRILERDGVVTIQPRHGARVTELSSSEMAEIYEIRAALLGLACSLFAARCSSEDVEHLEETYRKMNSVLMEDEDAHALAHAELSATMATYICEHCGNRKLAELLQQMSLQIARYTKLGLSAETRRKQSRHNWKNLLQALRKNDSARAMELGQKLVHDNLAFALTLFNQPGAS